MLSQRGECGNKWDKRDARTAESHDAARRDKRITDGNYDKSLAVKCVNGTFVGMRAEGVITYKGIPFVGRQPVGKLRWKAPADVAPNDGVYEA